MTLAKGTVVKDQDDVRGTVETTQVLDGGRERVLLRFDGDRQVMVSPDILMPQDDGGYRLLLSVAELEPYGGVSQTDEAVIPVIREEAQVKKRRVETGRVRISKHVHEREEQVDVPLIKEEVEVKRVSVDRVVDGPVPVRQEGDVTIVPLLEEVLVVEKKLVLKEEVHIGKKQTQRSEPQMVTLRSEEVDIERIDRRDGSL